MVTKHFENFRFHIGQNMGYQYLPCHTEFSEDMLKRGDILIQIGSDWLQEADRSDTGTRKRCTLGLWDKMKDFQAIEVTLGIILWKYYVLLFILWSTMVIMFFSLLSFSFQFCLEMLQSLRCHGWKHLRCSHKRWSIFNRIPVGKIRKHMCLLNLPFWKMERSSCKFFRFLLFLREK